jgi:peptide deformylase
MIRPIVKWGTPVLHEPSAPVEKIDDGIRKLIEDMVETMYAAPGIGLAAPQIGVPLRVIVVDLSVGEDKKQLIKLVNPEFVSREGEQKVEEGCLSIPGYGGSPRSGPRAWWCAAWTWTAGRGPAPARSCWPGPSAMRSTTSTACSSSTASPR